MHKNLTGYHSIKCIVNSEKNKQMIVHFYTLLLQLESINDASKSVTNFRKSKYIQFTVLSKIQELNILVSRTIEQSP